MTDHYGFTPCTDENCRSHGELVRLRRQMRELREWCASQDALSKGVSMTTSQIYKIIGEPEEEHDELPLDEHIRNGL